MALPLNSNPITDSQDYDVIVVAGVTSPGIVKLSGFKRPHEWDVKKGKGSFGSTTTFVGRPPAKGTLTFQVWLASQFDDWDDFVPLFNYDPTKKTVNAVEVYHPLLADIDIHSVVTENISAWENDGKGLWTRTVDLLEYFPAPKVNATATPKGADANAKPNDPYNTQSLDALDKQATALKDKINEAKDATSSTFGS